MSESTGELIRKFRKERGLTQQQLGKLCGIADSNIRKYENGGQRPKIETLRKIANALNIPVSELLEYEIFETGEEFDKRWKEVTENNHEKTHTFIHHVYTDKEKKIIASVVKLNEKGQDKILEYLLDLFKIPEYRNKNF